MIIIINISIVIAISAKTAHPNAIAVVPAAATRRPCVVASTTNAAAEAATCCHSAETRLKSEAIPRAHAAIWEIAREGNGRTSTSDPVRTLRSSCQPGNVAIRQIASAERARAASLRCVHQPGGVVTSNGFVRRAYSRPGNTTPLRKRPAISMTFRGSLSTSTPPSMALSPGALLEHNQVVESAVSFAQRLK